MLLVQDLGLFRSDVKIFEDISMSLTSEKIILLKGKNGSGKTSFIKTLLNILEPTSGSIYWKSKIVSKNLNDYYNSITYIADRTSSIKQLSVYENIKIWKKNFLSKVSDEQIEKILSILYLEKYINNKVNRLSLGEIKKLELLRLIIENKKMWFLDEPFTNLDNHAIDVISQTFLDHSNNGGCIIFISHQESLIKISEEIVF